MGPLAASLYTLEAARHREVQHDLHPRRPGARPVNRRHHHPDLSDVHLRPGGARQAQGLRVRAHAESRRGPRSRPISPRSRTARRRSRFASGMAADRRGDDAAPVRATTSSSPTTPTAAPIGCSSACSGSISSISPTSTRRTSATIAAAIRPKTKMLFLETPTNPTLRLTDLRGRVRGRARAQRGRRRRQHVRQPVRAAADRVRRRPGRPQHDEVPQRPQRQRRRRRRRDARRPHRVAAVRAERRGRHPRADGRVARAARHQDAADPDGAAQRQRDGARRVPRRAPEGEAVHYPGLPRTRSTRWRRRQMRGLRRPDLRSRSARSRTRGRCSTASG